MEERLLGPGGGRPLDTTVPEEGKSCLVFLKEASSPETTVERVRTVVDTPKKSGSKTFCRSPEVCLDVNNLKTIPDQGIRDFPDGKRERGVEVLREVGVPVPVVGTSEETIEKNVQRRSHLAQCDR